MQEDIEVMNDLLKTSDKVEKLPQQFYPEYKEASWDTEDAQSSFRSSMDHSVCTRKFFEKNPDVPKSPPPIPKQKLASKVSISPLGLGTHKDNIALVSRGSYNSFENFADQSFARHKLFFFWCFFNFILAMHGQSLLVALSYFLSMYPNCTDSLVMYYLRSVPGGIRRIWKALRLHASQFKYSRDSYILLCDEKLLSFRQYVAISNINPAAKLAYPSKNKIRSKKNHWTKIIKKRFVIVDKHDCCTIDPVKAVDLLVSVGIPDTFKDKIKVKVSYDAAVKGFTHLTVSLMNSPIIGSQDRDGHIPVVLFKGKESKESIEKLVLPILEVLCSTLRERENFEIFFDERL